MEVNKQLRASAVLSPGKNHQYTLNNKLDEFQNCLLVDAFERGKPIFLRGI
jgi:hypothetical protein